MIIIIIKICLSHKSFTLLLLTNTNTKKCFVFAWSEQVTSSWKSNTIKEEDKRRKKDSIIKAPPISVGRDSDLAVYDSPAGAHVKDKRGAGSASNKVSGKVFHSHPMTLTSGDPAPSGKADLRSRIFTLARPVLPPTWSCSGGRGRRAARCLFPIPVCDGSFLFDPDGE